MNYESVMHFICSLNWYFVLLAEVEFEKKCIFKSLLLKFVCHSLAVLVHVLKVMQKFIVFKLSCRRLFGYLY